MTTVTLTEVLHLLPLAALTLAAYWLSLQLYRRSKGSALLLPVATAVPVVLVCLHLAGVPYQTYARANLPLQWLIGPATVALAIPLYGQLRRLRHTLVPVGLALLAGALTAIVSAVGISRLFGASLETQASLAPKSLTMPIAMDIAALTGGIPALASIAVAITGISGGIIGTYLFRAWPGRSPEAQGFALGLTAHAIGVARGLQLGSTAAAFAALGMGLNGIFSAFLLPLLWSLWG